MIGAAQAMTIYGKVYLVLTIHAQVGYRLPTESEFSAELASWGSVDLAGAFASPLKLPLAGFRYVSGRLDQEGAYGTYWSSTIASNSAVASRSMYFSPTLNAGFFNIKRFQ